MERYMLEYETGRCRNDGRGLPPDPTLRTARLCARQLITREIAWPPEVRIWRKQRNNGFADWEHDRRFEPEDII